MKNLILALSCLLLITACDSDKSLSKKVPGWYTVEKKMDNGVSLSGKLTYYKNGDLKIVAIISGEVAKGYSVKYETTAKGTWSVENGYLKEDITEFITNPQILGDQLLELYKKEYENSKGDKILNVDKDELKIKNSKGEIYNYKRIEK